MQTHTDIHQPAYASTTTLERIRAARPCEDGWQKLLKHLGKSKADNDPLDLLTVLNSNGLDDALWVLSCAMPDDRLARHFQAWCAEQVLHIFEAAHPDDARVRDQIAVLRNDSAPEEERAAASDAAWDAARASDAAGAAASAAAWDAARASDAAWAAASAAAWDAARASDATWAAARAAAHAAAWEAARAAECARGAARDASRTAQEKQLRLMLGARR